jgi:elongation factor Ts
LEITVQAIKELRERTGAGMLDCKKALTDAGGNLDEAVRVLREKGLAAAAKRADREAREGRIECYAHHSNRVGSMVELNCETDFVGRTEEFITLAHDLALQVAATNPLFLSRDDIPEEVLEEERAKFRQQFQGDKPPHIVDRIVEGKMSKFYQEACLLEQPFIRDSDLTVQDLLNELIAKTGENVVLRRFSRFELGA